MITPDEVAGQAGRWGVAPSQIEKDHMISHLLAAIAETGFPCRFYGGTALNRSHVAGGRLSEDIDLMVDDISVDVGAVLRRPLLRHVGDTTWELRSRRTWMRTYDVTALGTSVQLQLVRFDRDDRRWGWEQRPVELRYSCLPDHVVMNLPVRDGFVAMKLNAYTERWAPRDLMDLANLAGRGAITARAVARYRHATGRGVSLDDFASVRRPTRAEWNTELGHQMAEPGEPEEAVQIVHDALASAARSA